MNEYFKNDIYAVSALLLKCIIVLFYISNMLLPLHHHN